MGWTTRGKVNVVLNSAVVTGVGSLFLQDGRIGDGFRGPDGRIYEVTNIATNTGLTIQPPYEGPTVNNATYYLAPFEGYVKDTADALRAASVVIGQLPLSKQDKSDNLTAFSGLTGAADRIPYFTGAGALSLATLTAKARLLMARTDTAGMQAELGLGTAATANVTATQFGGTTGQLMKVGDFGLGSNANAWVSDVNALTTSRFFSYGYTVSANISPGMDYGEGVILFGANFNEASALFMNHDTDRTFGKRKRAGVWQAPYEFHTTANSKIDPALNTGGLMSSTVVSGFRVDKYANGSMCVTGKVSLPPIPANEYPYQTLNLPVSFLNTANMQPSLTARGFNSVDMFGVTFQISDSPSSVIYAVRNGGTAQGFEVNVTIWGTWK